jgi:hypothetical protein
MKTIAYLCFIEMSPRLLDARALGARMTILHARQPKEQSEVEMSAI